MWSNGSQEFASAKPAMRPDHVQTPVEKMRQEGLRSALTQARAGWTNRCRWATPRPGWSSNAASGVQEFKPGDRVCDRRASCRRRRASGEISVRGYLTGCLSRKPPTRQSRRSALQGVRLAKLGLGDRVLIIGPGPAGAACRRARQRPKAARCSRPTWMHGSSSWRGLRGGRWRWRASGRVRIVQRLSWSRCCGDHRRHGQQRDPSSSPLTRAVPKGGSSLSGSPG